MSRFYKLSAMAISLLSAVMLINSCAPETVSVKTAIISFMGSVEITRGTEPARQVVLGEELKQGDIIKTGPASFMVFSLGETATARVQPDSSVTLSNITDMSNINLDLTKGGVLNRVNKLSRGGNYRINTPTVVASVRGTVFSAYYEEGTNTVAVKNGNVNVEMKDKNETVSLKDGNTAVIKDGIVQRPIEEVEAIVLENMTVLPIKIDIEDRAQSEKLNQQIIEKDIEINKQLEIKGIPKTLSEIKEKYERIDEVLLYSGRIIRGVIVERGASYRILTTSGYVEIPAKQVRNTKVLR